MVPKRARTWSDLVGALEENIRQVRSDYSTQSAKAGVEAHVEDSRASGAEPAIENDFFQVPVFDKLAGRTTETGIDLIGPDFSGVQIFARPELLKQLRLNAIADACTEDIASKDGDTWALLSDPATYRRPAVHLKQNRHAIEADASCLNHWSQTMLSPDGPRQTLSMYVIHPAREEQSRGIDEQWIAEYQSIFEQCTFDLAKVRGIGTYAANRTNWESTARNLGAKVRHFVHDLRQQHGPTVFLIIWPDWASRISALACCSEAVAHNDLSTVAVRLIPEAHVLAGARWRRSRLVAHSLACYSMLGSAPPVRLGTSHLLNQDPSTETNGNEMVVNHVENPQRAHMALVLSKDGAWLACAWCLPQGHHLRCDVRHIPVESSLIDVVRGLVEQALSVTKRKHLVISTCLPVHIPIEESLVDLPVTCIRAFSVNTQVLNSKLETDILRELDDLAFLSSVLPNASKGARTNVGLGTIASQADFEAMLRPPLHIKAARVLAATCNGLVNPGSDVSSLL